MVKSTKKLCISASVAGLLVGCAAVATQEAATYTPQAPGSSWQMSYQNTGSYGKDADVVVTRGEATWQGSKVGKITRSDNGMGILILPNGKWAAVVGRDGTPMTTFDPPLGYEFPLKVGKSWSTQHKVTNLATKRVVDFEYSCAVQGVDRVTVRAGTFDAFRIACENKESRTVWWYDAANGVNVKVDNVRKPGSPEGEGTQHGELVALNLAK